jgi:hypothetical protein
MSKSQYSSVRALLVTSLSLLESEDEREYERVVWRLADAGLLLRTIFEGKGVSDLCGLDRPTGLGAKLPERMNDDKGREGKD